MKLKVQPRGSVVSTNAWCLRGLPPGYLEEAEFTLNMIINIYTH